MVTAMQAAVPDTVPEENSLKGRAGLGPSLLTGMSALGVALGFERGASFLANVLAARLAGAETFGAYSLALTTANNIASYAGAGIGMTANRFVGQFPPGTKGYRGVLRGLAVVALTSALIATAGQWALAKPMARVLLNNPKLAVPLQVAAISAAAFILLECCRGLLLGQRTFWILMLLSVLTGTGLVVAVPLAAHFGLIPMLAAQSAAVLTAVLVTCFLVYRAVGPGCDAGSGSPSVGKIWSFGLVQLSGVIGLNAAGWWVASLVARSDPSLVQMAFFALAGQLRNMAALAPSLVPQSSLAMLTDEGSRSFGGSDRVLLVSSLVAGFLATICAGTMSTLLPWILSQVYGARYMRAELAAALALSTALIHMAGGPAASRLAVRSLEATGIINLCWTVVVVAASTWLVPGTGSVAAMACFLGAHALSMMLVLTSLGRRGELPQGVARLSMVSVGAALSLAACAWLRVSGVLTQLEASALCGAVTIAAAFLIVHQGRANGVVPRLPVRLQWRAEAAN